MGKKGDDGDKGGSKESLGSSNDSVFSDHPDDDLGKCGYGSCTPDAVQCCSNAKGFLVAYCFFVTVQGMLVNGIINVSISSLEKRYNLQSSETAVVATGYDMAFCVATMFVTYFGGRSHRPRLVAIGCVTMAVGALIFSLPQFVIDKYGIEGSFSDTCEADSSDPGCDAQANLHNYLYVFILGQLLHGFGCTPLYTLGLSFIEDSVPKESASIYIGIGNGASIFGPVLGYGLGGIFLGIYVDFYREDMETLAIDSSDPRWVGAWWLGIVISAALAFLVAIPFFAFPKEFSTTAAIRKARVSEVHANEANEIAKDDKFGKSFKDFPKALMLLLKNPTYVFVSLAGATEAMLIAGFTTFLPKIIENQYQQTAGFAALVAGFISIPGGVVGHIIAGLLVKLFKLKTPTILKFNVAYCIAVCCFIPILLSYCPNRQLAGITTPYDPTLNVDPSGELLSVCNTDCNCQQEYYIPVCGANDTTSYFTACHAGCTGYRLDANDTKIFTGCECLGGGEAVEGNCDENCDKLPLFLGIMFVAVMFTFMSSTPSLVVTFRVVPENMRSFALGVQWLFIRALGSIPGPIMFGAIIDKSCILWQEKRCTGERGNCWVYSSSQLALYVIIVSCACKIASMIFFSTACYLYKAPVEHQEESKYEKEDMKEIKMGGLNESYSAEGEENSKL